MDLALIALAIVLFGLTVGLMRLCDKLIGGGR
jgi:hypothetical protein